MKERSPARIAWALRQIHVPAGVGGQLLETIVPIPGGRLVARGALLLLQTETPVAKLPPELDDLVLVVREHYARACAAAEERAESPRLDEKALGVRAAVEQLCASDLTEKEEEPTRPGRGVEAS